MIIFFWLNIILVLLFILSEFSFLFIILLFFSKFCSNDSDKICFLKSRILLISTSFISSPTPFIFFRADFIIVLEIIILSSECPPIFKFSVNFFIISSSEVSVISFLIIVVDISSFVFIDNDLFFSNKYFPHLFSKHSCFFIYI